MCIILDISIVIWSAKNMFPSIFSYSLCRPTSSTSSSKNLWLSLSTRSLHISQPTNSNNKSEYTSETYVFPDFFRLSRCRFRFIVFFLINPKTIIWMLFFFCSLLFINRSNIYVFVVWIRGLRELFIGCASLLQIVHVIQGSTYFS